MGWLKDLGATNFDVFIVIVGVLFALYVRARDNQAAKRDDVHREDIRALWAEVKELRHKYSQVDKLTYGIGIAIQRRTGVKLVKQSADGDGDTTLNRNVE